MRLYRSHKSNTLLQTKWKIFIRITVLIISTSFRDRVKTKLDKTGEVKAFSQTAISNNQAVVEYCRTSMAALSGGAAGIMGLSTLYGFAFYAVSVVVLWLMILWKVGSEWKKFFGSRQSLLTSGFFGQMFTYVLFWTFLYGMVHVY